MRMFCTLFLTFVAIFNYSESSSRNTNDWSPPSLGSDEILTADEIANLLKDTSQADSPFSGNDGHHTTLPRTSAEHSTKPHQLVLKPNQPSPRAGMNPHSGRNPGPSPSSSVSDKPHTLEWISTDQLPLRVRSRSPVRIPIPVKLLGYPLGELGYIRLTPHTNHNLTFELRSYSFAAGVPVYWKKERKKFTPIPVKDHIVLSTSSGDIFAILEYSGVLFGLYRRQIHNPRAKVNMISGVITNLTPDEIRDCPVGKKNPVFPGSFIKTFSHNNSLHIPLHHSDQRNTGSSSSVRYQPRVQSPTPREPPILAGSYSPPGRPPTHTALGYTMDQLGYVRLIPRTNRNKRFEFRRYLFPAIKQIVMRIEHRYYVLKQNRQYIVLSASNGDVCAILDDSETLHGIYTTGRNKSRMKINMLSGVISSMTPDEMKDCPVGKNCSIIPGSFDKVYSEGDSLKHLYQ